MENIRSILLPTDFSEAATNSLEYTLALASGSGTTRIIVLHSFHVPTTTVETTYVADQAILLEQTEKRAQEEMRQLKEKYLEPSGIPYECLVELGPTMDSINNIVKENSVDLVVMATHKASKLERLLGSLPVYALEHCKAPLLLVPDKARFKPVKRLAFATDLKTYERAVVLGKLSYLAAAFQAQVAILNVHTGNEELSGEEMQELEHIRQELQGLDYHLELIEGEDAEEGILEYVEQEEIDMVAAVPRNHSFFEGLFHSSISEKLALHTRVPMLAIHE